MTIVFWHPSSTSSSPEQAQPLGPAYQHPHSESMTGTSYTSDGTRQVAQEPQHEAPRRPETMPSAFAPRYQPSSAFITSSPTSPTSPTSLSRSNRQSILQSPGRPERQSDLLYGQAEAVGGQGQAGSAFGQRAVDVFGPASSSTSLSPALQCMPARKGRSADRIRHGSESTRRWRLTVQIPVTHSSLPTSSRPNSTLPRVNSKSASLSPSLPMPTILAPCLHRPHRRMHLQSRGAWRTPSRRSRTNGDFCLGVRLVPSRPLPHQPLHRRRRGSLQPRHQQSKVYALLRVYRHLRSLVSLARRACRRMLLRFRPVSRPGPLPRPLRRFMTSPSMVRLPTPPIQFGATRSVPPQPTEPSSPLSLLSPSSTPSKSRSQPARAHGPPLPSCSIIETRSSTKTRRK